MDSIGYTSLFNMTVVILSIALSWWALQSLRMDILIKQPGSGKAKLLHLILAIFIGHGVGRFMIEYANWSSLLKYLFQQPIG